MADMLWRYVPSRMVLKNCIFGVTYQLHWYCDDYVCALLYRAWINFVIILVV